MSIALGSVAAAWIEVAPPAEERALGAALGSLCAAAVRTSAEKSAPLAFAVLAPVAVTAAFAARVALVLGSPLLPVSGEGASGCAAAWGAAGAGVCGFGAAALFPFDCTAATPASSFAAGVADVSGVAASGTACGVGGAAGVTGCAIACVGAGAESLCFVASGFSGVASALDGFVSLLPDFCGAGVVGVALTGGCTCAAAASATAGAGAGAVGAGCGAACGGASGVGGFASCPSVCTTTCTITACAGVSSGLAPGGAVG